MTGLADGNGTLRAAWDYDAFGNCIVQSGDKAEWNPVKYSSEYHDKELDLIYYNYRHYNPKDGRWISRDPIGEYDIINLYVILSNNCISSVDYIGLTESQKMDSITEYLLDNRTGNVGIQFRATFEKEKKCCYIVKKVEWRIRKVLSIKEAFPVPDKKLWDKYVNMKEKSFEFIFHNSRPLTFEGLDAHESEHVSQFESIADEINNLFASEYSKLKYCFSTTKKRDEDLKLQEEKLKEFVNVRWDIIVSGIKKLLDEKYPAASNSFPSGEKEAIQKEMEKYKEQYSAFIGKQ